MAENRSKKMILKLGALAAASIAGLSFFAFQSDTGAGGASATDHGGTAAPTMIAARQLDCTLGRIANFDPNRDQKPSEWTFDGQHKFTLQLPETPVRTTPPPESTEPPEPVDPQTRIIADPDGLTSDSQGRAFERVVDYWPQRVEMTMPINEVAVNLIVIDQIDSAGSKATMFLTKANDAVTFDLKNLYYGRCDVKSS